MYCFLSCHILSQSQIFVLARTHVRRRHSSILTHAHQTRSPILCMHVMLRTCLSLPLSLCRLIHSYCTCLSFSLSLSRNRSGSIVGWEQPRRRHHKDDVSEQRRVRGAASPRQPRYQPQQREHENIMEDAPRLYSHSCRSWVQQERRRRRELKSWKSV